MPQNEPVPEEAKDILRRLREKDPTLRELQLTFGDESLDESQDYLDWFSDFMKAFLSSSTVQSIEINGEWLESLPPHATELFFRRLQMCEFLQEFVLMANIAPESSYEPLGHILTGSPNLKRLWLHDVRFMQNSDVVAFTNLLEAKHDKLTSLSIDGFKDSFLDIDPPLVSLDPLLQSLNSFPSLQHLYIDTGGGTDIDAHSGDTNLDQETLLLLLRSNTLEILELYGFEVNWTKKVSWSSILQAFAETKIRELTLEHFFSHEWRYIISAMWEHNMSVEKIGFPLPEEWPGYVGTDDEKEKESDLMGDHLDLLVEMNKLERERFLDSTTCRIECIDMLSSFSTRPDGTPALFWLLQKRPDLCSPTKRVDPKAICKALLLIGKRKREVGDAKEAWREARYKELCRIRDRAIRYLSQHEEVQLE